MLLATVTSVSPVEVRTDDAQTAAPALNTEAALAVNDRVVVAMLPGRRLVVLRVLL